MGRIIDSKKVMTSTDLGVMSVEIRTVQGFNVEDLIRIKSISEARRVQFINLGQNINVNSPTTERTIKSVYFKNNIELPS